MPALNIYVKNPDTVAKAKALVSRRGLSSISELFEKLIADEETRKHGVSRNRAAARKGAV